MFDPYARFAMRAQTRQIISQPISPSTIAAAKAGSTLCRLRFRRGAPPAPSLCAMPLANARWAANLLCSR
jgi:hypothetical protein